MACGGGDACSEHWASASAVWLGGSLDVVEAHILSLICWFAQREYGGCVGYGARPSNGYTRPECLNGRQATPGAVRLARDVIVWVQMGLVVWMLSRYTVGRTRGYRTMGLSLVGF